MTDNIPINSFLNTVKVMARWIASGKSFQSPYHECCVKTESVFKIRGSVRMKQNTV